MDDTEFEIRDLTELGEIVGTTEKQTKFAAGLLAGMNQSEAAHYAGYAGERDSVQLRSAASTAARSKPVMALLALAESRGLGVPSSPGDRDELRRILWSHARSKDKTHSIRAAVELERIEKEDLAARASEIREPKQVLLEIAEIYPEFAEMTARHCGVEFDAWGELSDEQRGKIESYRADVARDWIKKNRTEALALLSEGAAHA